MWLGLAALFAASGAGIGYVAWRTGRILRGLEQELHRTVDGVMPVIDKSAVSMDLVNDQLAKVDIMLESAVDMTEALDATVRAVTYTVAEPLRAVSAAIAGVTEAVRSFGEGLGGSAPTRDAAAGASDVRTAAPAGEGDQDDQDDAAVEDEASNDPQATRERFGAR
jgi:hypothetical protein